jgi:hypothetical protein
VDNLEFSTLSMYRTITSWMPATTILAKNSETVASVSMRKLSGSRAVCVSASNSARNAPTSSSHQRLLHEDLDEWIELFGVPYKDIESIHAGGLDTKYELGICLSSPNFPKKKALDSPPAGEELERA